MNWHFYQIRKVNTKKGNNIPYKDKISLMCIELCSTPILSHKYKFVNRKYEKLHIIISCDFSCFGDIYVI